MSPLQVNKANGEGKIYAAQDGNVIVYNYSEPRHYALLPFENPRFVGTTQLGLSSILSAEHEFINYLPRPKIERWLGDWRDDETVGVTVRLIHAPAGQGKTRLARQFAVQSQEKSWTVITARQIADPLSLLLEPFREAQTVSETGLLIVVDYADRWPLDSLFGLISQHHKAAVGRIRVLLLARSEAAWWNPAKLYLGRIAIQADQCSLEPIAVPLATRYPIYLAARAQFLSERQITTAPGEAPPLDHPDYSSVLALHMRALADTHALERGDEPIVGDSSAVTAYLLSRERAHWSSEAKPREYRSLLGVEIARTAYVATLSGPLKPKAAASLLRQASICTTDEHATRLITFHSLMYPPSPPTVLMPLQPDRIAEDFVGSYTPSVKGLCVDSDPWASDAVIDLLKEEFREERREPSRVLSLLIAAAARWPDLADLVVGVVADEPRAVMFMDVGSVQAFVQFRLVTTGLLSSILRNLPKGVWLDWDLAGSVVATRAAAILELDNGTMRERIQAEEELSGRCRYADLWAEAYVAIDKAVSLQRKLIDETRIVTPADLEMLATLLMKLSRAAFDAWDAPGMLAASSEAAAIVEAFLDERAPDSRFYVIYAVACSKLAAALGVSGDERTAPAMAQMALRVFRRLKGCGSVHYNWLDHLAASIHLAQLAPSTKDERGTLVVEATNEAVEILDEAMPPYGPQVARALSIIGVVRGHQSMSNGQYSEAVEFFTEAIFHGSNVHNYRGEPAGSSLAKSYLFRGVANYFGGVNLAAALSDAENATAILSARDNHAVVDPDLGLGLLLRAQALEALDWPKEECDTAYREAELVFQRANRDSIAKGASPTYFDGERLRKPSRNELRDA